MLNLPPILCGRWLDDFNFLKKPLYCWLLSYCRIVNACFSGKYKLRTRIGKAISLWPLNQAAGNAMFLSRQLRMHLVL